MKYNYKVSIFFDLDNISEKIQFLEESINRELTAIGFNQNVKIASEVPVYNISSSRILTEEQKSVLKNRLTAHFSRTVREIKIREISITLEEGP